MFNAIIKASTAAFAALASTVALGSGLSTAPEPPEHAHDCHHSTAAGGHGAQLGADHAADEAKVARWTCPMHSEVVSDEPGKCPICGMKLVEQKDPPTPGDEK
jgi:hypothetical protein